MKHLNLLACAALFAISGSLFACDKNEPLQNPPVDETVAVTGVTLDEDAVSGGNGLSSADGNNPAILYLIEGGEAATLAVKVLPSNATNKNVKWEIDDNTVATVAGGVVTPVAEGTATVTVTTIDGGFEVNCTVVVAPAGTVVSVERVTLNQTSATIAVGATVTLTPVFTPVNATNKAVTWRSGNDAVATVAEGVVTGVAAGSTTITVITADGGLEATCAVTVEGEGEPPVSLVEDMRISRAGATLRTGQSFTLTATIMPATAPQDVTFTSSNTTVATVTAGGLVTALSNGTADITVASVGLTADGQRVGRICAIMVSDEIGRRCKTDTPPEWGETLGTPYFATNQTWDLGGVIWSDAVEITGGEAKLTYNGGNHNTGGYRSDYRHNPGYKGDLFSWCAVVFYGEEFCPDEWRVPTVDDFVALDKALGGNGLNQSGTQIVPKYLSDWGGQLAGWAPYNSNTLGNPVYSSEVNAIYWTANEYNEYEGNELLLNGTNGSNQPLNHTGKGVGATLRCVKDK